MARLADDVGIIWEILKLKKRMATLTVDDGLPTEKEFKFNMLLVTCMNSKFTGDGLALSPYATIDDGVMDVVLNSAPIKSRLKAIALFDGVKAGGKHVYDRQVTYAQCQSLRLTTPKPTRLSFDGETVGATPLETKLIPKALRIIVPEVLYPPNATPEVSGLTTKTV